MADISLQAESVCANPHDTIITLAQDIQVLAGRVRHLLAALDHANDEASFPDVDRKTQIHMLDRVLVFCALADTAAKEAEDKAEEIEKAVFHLERDRPAA